MLAPCPVGSLNHKDRFAGIPARFNLFAKCSREAFLRTEPSRGRVRNDILDGLVRMIERDQHSKKETGTFLGSALLWYACTAPEPFGSRVLQRAREGGSTITLDITRAEDNGWKFRWLLDAVEGTIH
jgi:hypothetical protein